MDVAEAKESIERYVEYGIPTGGFLRAVLANDLMEAMGRADESSRENLFEIVSYIYNHVTSTAHGSYKRVDQWIALKRAERDAGMAPTETTPLNLDQLVNGPGT